MHIPGLYTVHLVALVVALQLRVLVVLTLTLGIKAFLARVVVW
jgi:hypothetical protein